MLYPTEEHSVLPPQEFTHTQLKKVNFRGKWRLCTDWNKLLPRLGEEIYRLHYDDTTIALFRSELFELSTCPNAPTFAERFYERYSYIKVDGLNMYVRTSLSAERTVIQARTLIRYFGYSDSDLGFIVE